MVLEPVSRFTSLPLQASPASLPPASAPALLLPCAAALVRAPPHPSARRRDPRLLLLFRAVAPVRCGPPLPACRRSCWCCPASVVGCGRACASLSRRAAARARALAPACCRLAAASGGRRTSPGCRLLPLPTPGAALWLKPPLLCFARGTKRGPLLCSPPQARPGPPLCSPPLLCPLLCSAFFWSRGAALLCFSLGVEESSVPPGSLCTLN